MAEYELPTVKIKADSAKGYRIINASAFDPKVHVKYDEPTPGEIAPPPPAAVASPAPVDPLANLPADWRKGEPKALRDLAASLTGRSVENKAQAVSVIEAELAKRDVLPPPPV